jgi:NADPH-dependent 2,4-dienoyl-CoA reductase/sulfur reductase-like enzyme/Fe-S-cluster-containing hydrogenase component 2
MTGHRIIRHPVLDIPNKKSVTFTFNQRPIKGLEGEMIASALIAAGIHIFGHHPKDHSPQGIFCANGQCSQCLVMADGLPVKACMTPLAAGMRVESLEDLPRIPEDDEPVPGAQIPVRDVPVLIIGAGPAGLTAAIELGQLGVETLLVDDKDRLGGKLVLQTHKFFGSVEDSHAGTRGFEIADLLAAEIDRLPSIDVWLNSTAVGVFSDQVVGIVRNGRYHRIHPQKLMVATGAREKMLSFPGNTLPGVYGAGAFQTLVNRDLVRSAERVLVVGGGNVGLIAAYHAIQAGIRVVALIEALEEVGGYKVHADKLTRLGVPVYTRHTIVAAHGEDRVTSATAARLDENWHVIPGTEKTWAVDTVLVAVGLAEVNEFITKARDFGMDVFAAGDAQEIAEASAAMFTGRIEGLKIARALGLEAGDIPQEWIRKAQVLKSRPGRIKQTAAPAAEEGVFPVFHCTQEVPCNPCTSACPIGAIHTENDTITGLPFREEEKGCTGCLNCVAICPGLAITLVDYRKDPDHPVVTLPWEIEREPVEEGRSITVTDHEGGVLGHFPVQRVRIKKDYPRTLLVQVRMPKNLARAAAGIRVPEPAADVLEIYQQEPSPDTAVVCRCERITAGEIREAIRNGVRDMNQLKALTRAGMGACGSKTCRPLIWRIFQEEGIDLKEVTDRVDRPLFVEVAMGAFAGIHRRQHHE